MNEKQKQRPWRRLVFLLPAVLIAALVCFTLPNTQPVLAAVPELLKYEPTPTPEAPAPVDRSAQREEAEAKHANPTAGRTATVQRFTAPAAYKDGNYTGAAQGFGGVISVTATIQNGKLAGLRIDSAPGETEPYFSRAKAVVSRVLAAGSPNVDTVSGATFSSAGILNAAKQALRKAAVNPSPSPTPAPTASPAPKPSAEPAQPLYDGVYTASGAGYGGDIVVQLTVESGRITALEVLEAEDETPAYYNRAAALLPMVLETQSAELDAVSGATRSSNGILEAVRAAIVQAAAEPSPAPAESPEPTVTPEPSPQPTEVPEVTPEPTPEPSETPEVTPEPTPAPPRYADGEYTAQGWCGEAGNFRYEVIVTVTVEDGRITKVAVKIGEDESPKPEENDYFIDRAINGTGKRPGVPAQIVTAQGTEDIDGVSGATFTSNTIRSLVSEALRDAKIGGRR